MTKHRAIKCNDRTLWRQSNREISTWGRPHRKSFNPPARLLSPPPYGGWYTPTAILLHGEDIEFFFSRINMQGTRRVSEATSAFESNALRYIVRRHPSYVSVPYSSPPSLSPVPAALSRALTPFGSPYMIHEAHSSAIGWHDTHPTTVP